MNSFAMFTKTKYKEYKVYYNCLCGSVAKASYTQAVGHGFDPRPDH